VALIFWSLAFLIIYTYFGYPLILIIISKFKDNRIQKNEIYPYVSIIIAAHNEENSIKNKLQNTESLDYPREKLEIIVASDNSTDRTDEIVINYNDSRIRLITFPERKGKTFVQNEAIKAAKGEIILFSDATTIYDRQIVRKIVTNFADSRVGVVGGELEFINNNKSSIGEGDGSYWRYEKFIKINESRVTSLIGVSGCCYAIRRDLYEPIRPDLISDYVIAQMIYKKGKKAVYEPEAKSYEEANFDSSEEFKMRVRIAVRTLFGIWCMRELLNPIKYGFYAIQIISHKILRYSLPIFLSLLFLVNIALYIKTPSIFYKLSLYLQIFFYFIAFLGFISRTKKSSFFIPYYFCLTNFALLIGILQFIRGERKVLWSPLRK
jgi:cellulose synthase/poly-beta-1,6-N-acetylglucosamine synthase-like glycosyltransferase